jgi:hypothetical protein
MTIPPGHGEPLDAVTVHGLKNQLAIVLGFCELLAGSLDQHDPRLADVRQIQSAARAALALLKGRSDSTFGEPL